MAPSLTDQHSVGFVILGAGGYMGSGAFGAIATLGNTFQGRRISYEVMCAIESDKTKWPAIDEECTRCGIHPLPEKLENINQLQPFIRGSFRRQTPFPVVIYDATPPEHHYNHLTLILRDFFPDMPVYYLGEKPLFLDPAQIEHINSRQNYKFFCDLIETENPVFSQVKQYIERHNLQIQHLSFWRASTSGVSYLVGDGRAGVTGGALLDKAAHDFSLSVGLLEPENISDATVIARTPVFMIGDLEYATRGEQQFLTVQNRHSRDISTDLTNRDALTADAVSTVEVTWKLADGREVLGDYVFSWVGRTSYEAEQKIVNKLISLGFNTEKWLDRVEGVISKSGKYKYNVEEVRIGIIQCRSEVGQVDIICNFLAKHGTVPKRYAYAVSGKNRETIYEDEEVKLYDVMKKENMASVFATVADDCLGIKSASFIVREATIRVHEIILKAQNSAYTEALEQFRRAKAVTDERIIRI